MLNSRPLLNELSASLHEADVNVRTKQISQNRGVAMVYAVESDAYFEQLTFSLRNKVWILHRIDQGTKEFKKDHRALKKCSVEPRYWLSFEKEARVVYEIKNK